MDCGTSLHANHMRTFKRRCSSSADMAVSSAGHASTLPDGPGSSSPASSAASRGSASGTLPVVPADSCGNGGTPASSAGGSVGIGGASDGSGGGLDSGIACPLLLSCVASPFNIPRITMRLYNSSGLSSSRISAEEHCLSNAFALVTGRPDAGVNSCQASGRRRQVRLTACPSQHMHRAVCTVLRLTVPAHAVDCRQNQDELSGSHQCCAVMAVYSEVTCTTHVTVMW